MNKSSPFATDTNAPGAVPVMDDRTEAAVLIKSAASALGLTVTCGSLGVRALVAKFPAKRAEAERLLVRQGFYDHEARLHTGVVNSLRREGETLVDHARRNVRAAEALVAFLAA